MNLSITNEKKNHYKEVEKLTREAFWNLHVPGCDEHYLVHIMRDHTDFIHKLDFIALIEDKVVGNIMYCKSHVIDIDDPDNKIDTITFGPISVLPDFQRQGIGSALIKHSIFIAKENNYKAIVIEGHPYNYCKHGFKSSKDFNIMNSEGKYPYSLLVLELENDVFKNHKWKYLPSDVYEFDSNAAENFDKNFKPKKKEFRYSQEEFSIACRAFII